MKRSVNAWPLHNQDNEVDPCHLRFSKSQILFHFLKNFHHDFPYLVCCSFRWKLDWWRIYPMLWWPQHPGRQVRLDWRHWNRSMPTQSLGRFPWSSSHFHHGKWWHRICNILIFQCNNNFRAQNTTLQSIFVFDQNEATVTADCEGQITYTYGNLSDLNYCGSKSDKSMEKLGKNVSLNPRTQCGYFQCLGMITLQCEGACNDQ